MCKIVRSEKMMWPIFKKSNKRNKNQQSFEFTYSNSRKTYAMHRKIIENKI